MQRARGALFAAGPLVPTVGRLPLRERAFFRGAKDDNRAPARHVMRINAAQSRIKKGRWLYEAISLGGVSNHERRTIGRRYSRRCEHHADNARHG